MSSRARPSWTQAASLLLCMAGACWAQDDEPLRGVIVPMITPFRDGALDLEATAAFTDWLCERQISALFPVSGMGQWELLEGDEKRALISAVIEAAAGRRPVLAGVGGRDEAETLALAAHAEQEGAWGLVLVTPPWLRREAGLDQEAYLAYVRRVLAASALPLLLYDPRAEVHLATMARLRELPRVRGIKYRTRDALLFQRAVLALGPEQAVLPGIEHLTLPSLAVGGRGVVGGGANLFPDLLAELVRAAESGQLERARELQARVIEANDRLGRLGGRPALKRLLADAVGIPLSDEERGRAVSPAALDEQAKADRDWLIRNCLTRGAEGE